MAAPAEGLQPHLLPSLIDGSSNSRSGIIQCLSHLAGSIRKGLHRHVGSGAKSNDRVVPHLPDLFPALAAKRLASGIKRKIGWAAAVMRIHTRRYLGILRRLRRKAMLRGRVGHVAQTDEAPRLRSRAHYVVANQPIGSFCVPLSFPLSEHLPEAFRGASSTSTPLVLLSRLTAYPRHP